MTRVRWWRCVAAAAGLTVTAPAPSHAQTPADTARVLLNVGRDLLQVGDTAQAEAFFRVLMRRFPGAAAAADARAALDSVLAVRRDRGGRGELVAWSTAYGAALGLLIPAAFGAEDSEAYGVGLLLGAPLGFAGSKAYANSARGLTSGQARAITFGSWWGMWQGFGWREVFEWGDREIVQCGVVDCFTFREQSDQAPFTATVLGGLAGVTTGLLLSQRIDISASTALVSNFGALWGTWYGFATATLVSDDDGDPLLASTLIGGNVGLLAGALAAPSMNMTTGRAWLVHLSGIAGLIGGFGVLLIVAPDGGDGSVVIPMVTSALGLAIGFGTTSPDAGRDFAPAQFGAALLNWTSDGVGLGLPLPQPAVLPAPGDPRRVAPGLKVDLFRLSW